MKFLKTVHTWEVKAYWKNYPGWSQREQEFLLANIFPQSEIHKTIGKIKKKNDGRWEWTVLEDNKDFWFIVAQPLDKLQGVCQTKEEAIKRIEDSWGVYEK